MRIVFGSGVSRCVPGAGSEIALDAAAPTLRAALEHAFATHPALRGYVLDERGVVRHHVAIFVDSHAISDKSALDVPLRDSSEVHVMQALSGG